MQKTTALLLLFSFGIVFSKAQFFKSALPAEAFSDSISIIVQDFTKNFFTIQGVQLRSQGEMDVYRSNVSLPGALHCGIYRFHSFDDTTASWQAVMYEGESYENALKIYKNTFGQMKRSRMKWGGKNVISFVGEMEIPDENVRFTVSPLRLNIIDNPYRSFFGEVELASTYDGWEVHLNLFNRKNDAEQY